MTVKPVENVQASIKFYVLLWMLRIRGSVKGINPRSLHRVEEYLRISLGLRHPLYTQELQRPKHYFPGLIPKPWHEPEDYEWAAVLENKYETIKNEFSQIYSPERFRLQHQGLTDIGQWDVYYLYYSGRKAKDNCLRCPQTTQLIESISGVSNAGLAYFSVLSGGSHIAPHCGPLNTRLRCHLGLEVPEACHIRVGTETRSWEEGKCLVFDDSFEHEVWNQSNNLRAVLIIDFWHPDLTTSEIWALEQIMKVSPKAQAQATAVLKNKIRL